MLIITYHAVEGPSSPVCCPSAQLAADLAGLRDSGFSFVSLDQCADWVAGRGVAPQRAAAITFDDGYASVIVNGLPILERFEVPATLYVIGDRIGGDNQWPGQWASIPRRPLADATQLRAWTASGMSIGSHSWSHPRLPEVDEAGLSAELTGSADRLEQALGSTIRHFAYPYGFRGRREIEAAKARYATAVNATPGIASPGDDPHDLRRLDCHDLRLALRFKCLEPPAITRYLAARRGARAIRRQLDRALGRG